MNLWTVLFTDDAVFPKAAPIKPLSLRVAADNRQQVRIIVSGLVENGAVPSSVVIANAGRIVAAAPCIVSFIER